MTAETGMNDRQKLSVLNRFCDLYRIANSLITEDKRSADEVGVLLGAMQAFKEKRLAAIVCASKTPSSEEICRLCELELRDIPLLPDDRKYLTKRGVRFLGEIFYLWFDPRSAPSRLIGERITEVLAVRFGLRADTDPLALGWKPSYWNDRSCMDELNTLILGRCPTSEMATDWRTYLHQAYSNLTRGTARTCHEKGVHFFGEVVANLGRNEHCPLGKRSPGKLEYVQSLLNEAGIRLWAAFLVPSNWSVPSDWRGDLWNVELQQIDSERKQLDEFRCQQDRERQERRNQRRTLELRTAESSSSGSEVFGQENRTPSEPDSID